jgi:hypothetical protein
VLERIIQAAAAASLPRVADVQDIVVVPLVVYAVLGC